MGANRSVPVESLTSTATLRREALQGLSHLAASTSVERESLLKRRVVLYPEPKSMYVGQPQSGRMLASTSLPLKHRSPLGCRVQSLESGANELVRALGRRLVTNQRDLLED